MSEKADNGEWLIAEPTPAERVWSILSQIEGVAHTQSEIHSPHEIMSLEYVDALYVPHARHVMLLPEQIGDHIEYWPGFSKTDGSETVGYHLTGDDEIWHWPHGSDEGIKGGTDMIETFAEELQGFLQLMRRYPNHLHIEERY